MKEKNMEAPWGRIIEDETEGEMLTASRGGDCVSGKGNRENHGIFEEQKEVVSLGHSKG